MFHLTRRTPTADGIRFCDACASVSTAEQRAHRRYEHTRTQALAALR